MVRKRATTSETKVPVELSVPRDEAKSRLQERIKKGLEIKKILPNSSEAFETAQKEYSKWDDFNIELLKRLFTTDELAGEYSSSLGRMVFSYFEEPSLEEKMDDLHKDIDNKIHRIDSIIERLELVPLRSASHTNTPKTGSSELKHAETNKVFIVHGHEETAKTNLEVFLREIGLEPIVLHRQADGGLTLIEKLEKHSEVGYAFILLTPDEMAYLRLEEQKSDSERKKELRARQNVIFEFGYFVGRLGRSRVCCLYTGDVSLPSDVNGMIYKKFSKSIEEVAYSIIKDLKASGYEIA